MIFKSLLSRSVQTPNSDKNWQTSCPLQTFVCNISRHGGVHYRTGSPGQLGLRVAGLVLSLFFAIIISVILILILYRTTAYYYVIELETHVRVICAIKFYLLTLHAACKRYDSPSLTVHSRERHSGCYYQSAEDSAPH